MLKNIKNQHKSPPKTLLVKIHNNSCEKQLNTHTIDDIDQKVEDMDQDSQLIPKDTTEQLDESRQHTESELKHSSKIDQPNESVDYCSK